MADIVKTLCSMCGRYCGMNAYVENGKIIKVEGMPEHPVNRGSLCPRGLAAVQYEYDPKRLMHPLKRVGERGEGKWEQITWEEALEITAQRLSEIKEKQGARSIFFYKGQADGWESSWSHVKRFTNVLGSPNYGSHSHLCYIPFLMGQVYTMGEAAVSDIENAQCIVLWAFSPFTSNLFAGRRILDAKERGAKLVVIDPRFTETAAKADIFVRPRPGSDGALALGMLKVIMDEGLYDKEFVDKWTYGFDKLRELIQRYPPERVEKITGVSAETISEVARLYATTKPACIEVGNGIDQHTNAVQTSRAIAILITLSGNLDQPGGNVFRLEPKLADMCLADKLPHDARPLDQHPLFYRIWSVAAPDLVDTLLSGEPYPIKAMIVMAGDPAISLSETSRVREALKKLDFLMVHDLFMTASAELADIVMPAASFFEYPIFCSYRGPRVPANTQVIALRNKVVKPPGECHSDFELVFALARKLGCGDYFPWETAEEAFDEELKPTGITIKDLKEHREGIVRIIDPKELYRKYERRGFATPTKKVEIYSTTLEQFGYDALPTFEEPEESHISQPDLAKDYPLICSAAIKPVQYTHAQFRTVSWLQEIMPDAWVEIHPQKAKDLDLKDGQAVVVESPRGSIKVKAKFTEGIDPRTVFIPHGWGQPYAHGSADNFITPGSPCCPISASTGNRSFVCRIRKA